MVKNRYIFQKTSHGIMRPSLSEFQENAKTVKHMIITTTNHTQLGARWPSELELRTGDQVILGSNPAGGASLRNFGNSVYPTLPMSFGRETRSRRSFLSGVNARGRRRSHTGGKCVTWHGLQLAYRRTNQK